MTRWVRMAAIAQLLWLVFADIVRSNIAVGRIVLGFGGRSRTAGFLSMPLELRHPGGLAVMACIVTATPGTSWARYDAARGIVVIHVLDLIDEEAWIRIFKQRYERRLLEIFA
jgi:multicomponent K+:H+ antiporter subunit E